MKNFSKIIYIAGIFTVCLHAEVSTKEIRSPERTVFDITKNTDYALSVPEIYSDKIPTEISPIWGYRLRANKIDTCKTDSHSATYCPLEMAVCASQWDYKASTATTINKTYTTSPAGCAGIQVDGVCYTQAGNICSSGSYDLATNSCITTVTSTVPAINGNGVVEIRRGYGCQTVQWSGAGSTGFGFNGIVVEGQFAAGSGRVSWDSYGNITGGMELYDGWLEVCLSQFNPLATGCPNQASACVAVKKIGNSSTCANGTTPQNGQCTVSSVVNSPVSCASGQATGISIGGDASKCYSASSVCGQATYNAPSASCDVGTVSGSSCIVRAQFSNVYSNTIISSRAHTEYSGGRIRERNSDIAGNWIDLNNNAFQTSSAGGFFYGSGTKEYQDGKLRESYGATKGAWIDLFNPAWQESVIGNVGHIRYHDGLFQEYWGGVGEGPWISLFSCNGQPSGPTCTVPATISNSSCTVDYKYYSYQCAAEPNQFGKDYAVINPGGIDCGGANLVDTNGDGIGDSCTAINNTSNCKREKFACVANAARPCAEIAGQFKCSPFACDTDKKCGYAHCPTEFGITNGTETSPLSADPLKYVIQPTTCTGSMCDLVQGPKYTMCGKKSCPAGFGVYEKGGKCYKDTCKSPSVEVDGKCVTKQ